MKRSLQGSCIALSLHCLHHFPSQAGRNISPQDGSIGSPTNVLINDQANEQNTVKVEEHAGKNFRLRVGTKIALFLQQRYSCFHNLDEALVYIANVAANVLISFTDHCLSDGMFPAVLVNFAH